MRTETPTYAGEFTTAQWEKVCHRWNRWGVSYKRIPVTEGVISNLHDCLLVIFDNAECRKDAHVSIPVENLPDVDLDLPTIISRALKRAPKEARCSGRLGAEPKKEIPENSELVCVEVVQHDADTQTRREAWEIAVKETSYLLPFTPSDAEEACKERTEAYKIALESLGATIIDSYFIKRYVRLGDIDWSSICDKRTPMLPLDRQALGWYKSGVPLGMIGRPPEGEIGRK